MRRLKNKGFTLVELIAIIIVLAAIFLVAFPMILNSSKKAENQKYNMMVSVLCDAGKSYVYSNPETYELNSGDTALIPVSELVEYGIVDSEMKNPKTDEYVSNDRLLIEKSGDSSLSCTFQTVQRIPVPSTQDTCKANLAYTGHEIDLLKDRNTNLIYTNSTGTNAGDYVVTASIDPHSSVMWNDGTVEDKTFTCSVAKAEDTINILLANQEYSSTAFEATVTTKSGQSTTKTYYSDSACTTTATPIIPGDYYVTATTVGNSNYEAASSGCKKAITISQAKLTADLNCTTTKIYDNSATASCTLALSRKGTTYTPTYSCSYDSKDVGTNKPITCTVTALANENLNYYAIKSEDISTTGNIHNATLTFSTPEETLNGTSPLYIRKGQTGVYTGLTNSTAGEIPTASKIGYTFNGWKSPAGIKIINADKTLVAGVNGWVNTNSTWLLTSNQTLTSMLTANTYTITANSSGGVIPTTTGWTVASGGATATKTGTYDASYGTLPSPTKDGYYFDGWTYVPQEYRQVEYISSSGTQYINTGVSGGNDNLNIQVKYSWNSLPAADGYAAVFGNYSSENHNATRILNKGSSITYINLNTKAGGSTLTSTATKTVNTIYEDNIVKLGDILYYKSNDIVVSRTGLTTGTANSGNIAIFAQNTTGSNKSSIKLYGMQIYNGTTLVRNFVPCVRKSDNVAGLYDTANGVFYTNAGTGEFEAGEDAYVESSNQLQIAASHTLYAQYSTYKLTVKYHVNGGSITTSTSSATRYRVGSDSLVEISKDSGATWKDLTASITADSVYANLHDVATYGATKRGYSIVDTSAYNTAANGAGTNINQNYSASSTTNPATVDRINGSALTSNKTVSIYIKWVPNIYTITLNNQDATNAGTATIYEKYDTGYYLNSTATTQMTTSANGITVPTRTGYTFKGYYTTAAGGTQYIDANGKLTSSANNANFAENSTLYAHWEKAVSSLTNTLGTTTYIYDGTAKTPTPTAKDGTTTLTRNTDYTVSYSNNTSVGTATATFTGSNVYNATTKAFYTGTTNVSYYINNATLTFDKNGGTSGGGTVYTKTGATGVYTGIRSTTAGSIPSVARTGYSLTGWYTTASGGTKVLNANGTFTGTAVSGYTSASAWATLENKTLYAHWTDNIAPVVTISHTGSAFTGTITDAGTGVVGYAINNSNATLALDSSEWIDIDPAVASFNIPNTPHTSGGMYIHAKDAAGNVSKRYTSVSNIKIKKNTTGTYTVNSTVANNTCVSSDTSLATCTLTPNMNGSSLTNYSLTVTTGATEGEVKIRVLYPGDSVMTIYNVLIDGTAPTVSITGGTTQKATSQTLTLKCSDSNGITGYYWGTTNPTALSSVATTTSSDLTALASTNGLSKSVSAEGTYYLACRDATGNYNVTSKVIRKYSVQSVLETIAGTRGTYTSSNYVTNGSASSYIISNGSTITLSSVYAVPTGAASGTFKGYTTSAPGSSAASPSTTDPTVATNDTTVYYMWFDRNTYTVTVTKPTNGSIKAETVTKTSNSVTVNSSSSSNGSLTVKYGDTVKATATPSTGYSFSGWSGGYLTANTTSPQTGGTVTAAKTITGSFTINKYNLVIDPAGGTFNGSTSNTTVNQNYATSYTVANTPTKAGYTFGGWTLSGSGTYIAFDTASTATDTTTINYNSASSTLPTAYNNSGNGTVTNSMVTDSTATGGYSLRVVTNGVASPGTGGIYLNLLPTTADRVNVVEIRAKIPSGYRILAAGVGSRYTGVGSTYVAQDNTGNGAWKTYYLIYYMGHAGDFATTVYINLNGTTTDYSSTSSSVTWYVDYIKRYSYTKEQFKSKFTFGAGDATLTANWSKAGAKVIFNPNNGTFDTTKVKNWSFGYYSDGTATWRHYLYSNSYGTFPSDNSYNWTPDDRVISRTGYTFAGWYTSASGGTKVFNTDGTLAASVSGYSDASKQWIKYDSNVTLFAHWTDVGKPSPTISGGGTLKATSQSLTLKCTDAVGVTAYYWGTTAPTAATSMTTTTSADLTSLASSSGLSKSVSAAGTYYLGCRDAAGNWEKTSITIRKYQVQTVLETVAGTTGTYTSSNYTTSGSASTYYVKSGTSLTLASIYTIPTGAASGTFKGYTTSAPGSSAASPSTTAPTVATNDTTVYYMWFNRSTFALTLNKGSNISSVTGAGTYKYGKQVSISATPTTNYTFTSWTVGSGNTPASTTAASTTVTITQATTLTAAAADSTKPSPSISGGGTLKATSQSLTLKCTDAVGVTAYYWGTTAPTAATSMTTTTSADLTSLASSSGLSKSVSAAGTYYLGCRDAAGNWEKTSITIRKYQVQTVLETVAGTTGTYTSSNYTTSGSASTYYVKSGTSLTLASIYTIPTGAASGTFKGYTTSAPGSSAASPSTTAPTVATNDTTVYYMWFNRSTYTVTVAKPTYGSIKVETVTKTGNSTTLSAGASADGTLTVKYGDTVKATATPSTGYELSTWGGGYLTANATSPQTGGTVTANKSVSATWTPKALTITAGAITGTSYSSGYLAGATVTYTCTGSSGNLPNKILMSSTTGTQIGSTNTSSTSLSATYTISSPGSSVAPTAYCIGTAACDSSKGCTCGSGRCNKSAAPTAKAIYRKYEVTFNRNGAKKIANQSGTKVTDSSVKFTLYATANSTTIRPPALEITGEYGNSYGAPGFMYNSNITSATTTPDFKNTKDYNLYYGSVPSGGSGISTSSSTSVGTRTLYAFTYVRVFNLSGATDKVTISSAGSGTTITENVAKTASYVYVYNGKISSSTQFTYTNVCKNRSDANTTMGYIAPNQNNVPTSIMGSGTSTKTYNIQDSFLKLTTSSIDRTVCYDGSHTAYVTIVDY